MKSGRDCHGNDGVQGRGPDPMGGSSSAALTAAGRTERRRERERERERERKRERESVMFHLR